MTRFAKCIEVVLKNEGGYVNHSHDPGGETNMGITKRNYPDLDIKNLTKDEAVEIYHTDYWTPMNLELIKDENAALHIFDMGVNVGPKTAIKIAQRLVGVKDDGVIGPVTLSALNKFPPLADAYKQERKKFYFALARRKPELQVFLAGWLNRVDHCVFVDK